MNVTVVGAGAWGSALAKLLHENGHEVTVWVHEDAQLADLRATHRNDKYLPGIPLPVELTFESQLATAGRGAEILVMATPSKFFRTVSSGLSDFSGLAVSVTKGIEFETGLTMTGVLRQTIPKAKVAALSGPNFAMEVAKGIPGASVAANDQMETAEQVQRLFHRPTFRVYASDDLLGVELGGALKNVIAIAAGMCDGLGFGDNTKAALVTRAIAEIRRLGVACGAQPETFAGLSGLGDLTATCFSKLSRNRGFGERLARGEKAATILESAESVAEGYPTARSAWQLATKHKVQTPIIQEVYQVLYEEKDIRRAVKDLLEREMKAED